jgi:hypothetical protein
MVPIVRISPLTATFEPIVRMPLLFARTNLVPVPRINGDPEVTSTIPEIVFEVLHLE